MWNSSVHLVFTKPNLAVTGKNSDDSFEYLIS